MIYLKALLLLHQEELPLASPQNTVNITTYHTSVNKKITARGIMHSHPETGHMFGSSTWSEKNQHQHAKFKKPFQFSNSQENATGYISSPTAEIRTSSEPIYRKTD